MKEEKNFNEYETHIDSLISQYKNQLDNIKSNRIKKANGNSVNTVLTSTSFRSKIENDVGVKLNVNLNKQTLKENTINFTEDSDYTLEAKEVKNIPESKTKISVPTTASSHSEIIALNYNQKISNLTEENLKLTRKINELNKQLENKDELNINCEMLQMDLNKASTSESNFRKEKIKLEAKKEELENKVRKLEDKESKHDEVYRKMNEKLKDVEKNYEEVIKHKEEEIEYLKKNDQEKISIIQKLNIFLKRNLKYVLESDKNSEDINNYELSNYEASFVSLEKLINKLLFDNSELVKHLNILMNKNNVEEESLKVKKLNQMIEDLKMENHLLKHQLSNLSESKKVSKKSCNKSFSSINNNNNNNNSRISNKNDFISPIDNEAYIIEKKIKKSSKKKKSPDSFANNSDFKYKEENVKPIKIPIYSNNKVYQNIPEIKSQTNTKFNTVPTKETTDNNYNNVSTELQVLEKLKSKIKDLEGKIGEINKDEKEKKIIDSLREFRHRNISPNK